MGGMRGGCGGGRALPEESASVQAEASDGQPAQVPPEGAPPEGECPPEPPGGEGEPGSLPPQGPDGQPRRRPGDLQARGNGEPGHSRYYAGNGYHHQRRAAFCPKRRMKTPFG